MTDHPEIREVAALRQELDNERSTREALDKEIARLRAEVWEWAARFDGEPAEVVEEWNAMDAALMAAARRCSRLEARLAWALRALALDYVPAEWRHHHWGGGVWSRKHARALAGKDGG